MPPSAAAPPAGCRLPARLRRRSSASLWPAPSIASPTADQRLRPDMRFTVEFGTHSGGSGRLGEGGAMYAVAGPGGGSSFDLQQRIKVAKGLALEVRWGERGGDPRPGGRQSGNQLWQALRPARPHRPRTVGSALRCSTLAPHPLLPASAPSPPPRPRAPRRSAATCGCRRRRRATARGRGSWCWGRALSTCMWPRSMPWSTSERARPCLLLFLLLPCLPLGPRAPAWRLYLLTFPAAGLPSPPHCTCCPAAHRCPVFARPYSVFPPFLLQLTGTD